MLKIAHISPIKPGKNDEEYLMWKQARLAKFTSSEIHFLTYPTGLTEGSLSYIRRKVGEELTGNPAREEIDTNATRHGLLYEAEAVWKFKEKKKVNIIVVQQLITAPDSRFGGTPDGLILIRESPDQTEYEVETVEVKCPPSFDGYISLFECESPGDVKKVKREYYWQVLDQMLLCGASRGHFVIYHPDFKAGNHKSIVFEPLNYIVLDVKGKKIWPLRDDLKLLKERKQMALDKFDQIRSKLMAVPAI